MRNQLLTTKATYRTSSDRNTIEAYALAKPLWWERMNAYSTRHVDGRVEGNEVTLCGRNMIANLLITGNEPNIEIDLSIRYRWTVLPVVVVVVVLAAMALLISMISNPATRINGEASSLLERLGFALGFIALASPFLLLMVFAKRNFRRRIERDLKLKTL